MEGERRGVGGKYGRIGSGHGRETESVKGGEGRKRCRKTGLCTNMSHNEDRPDKSTLFCDCIRTAHINKT